MNAADLTTAQLDGFSIIERVGSVFSLLGCVFIISTFFSSKAFHKPINRLVFYASFGNAMTNVATLMARSYVTQINSAGCQMQAFLIQMFMPADAFWTLAMAVNVYLTFYYKYDAQKLRKMEIPYLCCCYGIPFIVALAFIFVNSPSQGRMYGNATLWCWISAKWDIYRIAAFYGPVWIVILITFFIYIRAGGEIYQKRKQLKNFSSHHEPEPLPPMNDPFSSSKTTEVFVTSEVVTGGQALAREDPEAALAAPRAPNPTAGPAAAYSVTISSNHRPLNRGSYGDVGLPIQSNVAMSAPAYGNGYGHGNSYSKEASRTAAAPSQGRRRQAFDANSAAWSYTKCAILFFTALLVTWIPSSANRVFSVVHANEVSLPLNFMSSLVLPLQGFWNALIYIVTSWSACKALFADILACSPRPRRSKAQQAQAQTRHHFVAGPDNFHMMSSGRNGSKTSAKSYETESMTELANSRPSSQEKKDGY